MQISIPPTHPVLLKMGARYVLALGESQASVSTSNLPIIYKSIAGRFTIFEIPTSNHSQALFSRPTEVSTQALSAAKAPGSNQAVGSTRKR